MSEKSVIKQLDRQITLYLEQMEEEIKQLDFDLENSVVINLSSEKSLDFTSNIPSKVSGIYMFEVLIETNGTKKTTTRLSDFVDLWNKKSFNSTYSSKVIQKRVDLFLDDIAKRKESKLDSMWVPIYIGKHKSIQHRIKEHIFLPPEKRTYALKLLSRRNLFDYKFKISFIPLEIENYNFIVPFIESTLRDKYNPIIGRQ